MFKGSNLLFFIAITTSVVILDYITKRVIEAYIKPFEVINILPFLNIVHIKNPGAAFGLFSGLGNKTFIFLSFATIILIVIYSLQVSRRLELFSLSLILSGAIGNLIDRFRVKKVIDFIDFFVDKWHWPAFNVADSALTAGIILFIWANIKNSKIKNNASNSF